MHILSSMTAAGDEIGWDFVNMVTNTQMSLSAFCTITNSKYYASKLSFMSRNTFTDWIFSWLANFNIDFRQPCKNCKYNPNVLACDGTKLGIFFKNVSLRPFDDATTDARVVPNHKRTSRQFFSYTSADAAAIKEEKRQAKQDLQYFTAKNQNCLKEWKKENSQKKNYCEHLEKDRKTNIIKHALPLCQPLISKFINMDLPCEVREALCPVMTILASNCPMTSLFSYRFINNILEVLDNNSDIDQLKLQMPEIATLIGAARNTENFDITKLFLKEIISKIKKIHSTDKEPGDASTILEPYNPELQGRAYYFTPHGGRLRDLPHYDIASSKDEDTSVRCKKSFPQTTKSGTTYLFLWFDPLHGHCYGFHIITTSEGRKDPFASAYMYMETAPNEVFYDFSCQLEEYVLNREPKFWVMCRFYHDIFHGFTHTCPFVYKSRRIPAIDVGVNSEICEQFNSYLQKIKYSARSMSQSHFIFYLQFFIHRWNEEKEKKFEAQKKVACSLLE